MRNVSHEIRRTPIRSLLRHVDAWRDAEGLSRDKVAQIIVDVHNANDGPLWSRVRFECAAFDAFKRAHVFASRIFRWFDDDEKDNNLLSVNFLPSILMAIPRERCIAWLLDFLRPLGLGVHSLNENVSGRLDAQKSLCVLIKEASEAHQAVAGLISSESVESLTHALKELTDVIEAASNNRAQIEARLAELGA
jgi:hypothetical protein